MTSSICTVGNTVIDRYQDFNIQILVHLLAVMFMEHKNIDSLKVRQNVKSLRNICSFAATKSSPELPP
jgi:hypothetical protein